MGLIFISVLINGIITFAYIPDLGEYGIYILTYWFFSLIVSMFYCITRQKMLGIMSIIGFAGFVPVGIIGLLGVRKLMDEDKKEEEIPDSV